MKLYNDTTTAVLMTDYFSLRKYSREPLINDVILIKPKIDTHTLRHAEMAVLSTPYT